MKTHRLALATALSAAALATTASAALALPPPGDPIIHCPPGYVVDGDGCLKLPPPPPPGHAPSVSLGIPRQTVDRGSIHINGSASDADQPNTSLTVRISVDGALVKTITANAPDQGSASPGFAKAGGVTPAGHSFDLTVPASPTAGQLCVTAVNVGGGTDTTMCRSVDRVVEFNGSAISYDLDHLQITNATLDELDKVDQHNGTNVQQSTTISGTKSVADTQGWSNTYGLKVTMSGGVSIPLISDFKVSVEGSAQWVQNGSETNTSTFTWSQPVLVPAKSEVVATVAVTKTTLTVPYTLTGTYLYTSGTRVAGTSSGTFTGVNSHDLQVTLQQFNLDGTPAVRAVQQPKATLLRQANSAS